MAARSMRIFISYTTSNKVLAGRLSQELESYGFRVFLAHHHLRPSEQWQQTIQQELRKCDLFLPLLTKNFHKSPWTDQEVGFVLGSEKSISPIKIDIMPYGFLSSRQAFTLNRKNVKKRCRTFVLQMLNRESKLRKLAAMSVITKLANSTSFIESREILGLLIDCDFLSKQEVNKVFQVSITNDQIYNYEGAPARLRRIVNKFKIQIDEKILRQARSMRLI